MKLKLPNGTEMTFKDKPGKYELKGLYPPLPELPSSPASDALEQSIRDMTKTRYEQLDKFTAALIREGKSVLDYQLVEEWQEKKVVWYFQKRIATRR